MDVCHTFTTDHQFFTRTNEIWDQHAVGHSSQDLSFSSQNFPAFRVRSAGIVHYTSATHLVGAVWPPARFTPEDVERLIQGRSAAKSPGSGSDKSVESLSKNP